MLIPERICTLSLVSTGAGLFRTSVGTDLCFELVRFCIRLHLRVISRHPFIRNILCPGVRQPILTTAGLPRKPLQPRQPLHPKVHQPPDRKCKTQSIHTVLAQLPRHPRARLQTLPHKWRPLRRQRALEAHPSYLLPERRLHPTSHRRRLALQVPLPTSPDLYCRR